jgi:adenosylcobinamide-GDP ribazoletransferase
VTAFLSGLRLALTTLTVLPVRQRRPGPIDRSTGATAMWLAPAVGLALGGVVTVVGWGLNRAGFGAFAVAVVLVVLLVVLTRALHLDGLADTVDALGSYRDRERALAIMRSPEVGPMGVAAIVLVLLGDAAALTSLISQRQWLSVAVGVAVGRLAITVCCRRGVPAARSDGLGAVVADTVPIPFVLAWTAVLGSLAAVGSDRRWPGPAAVVLAGMIVLLLLRQVIRRLGGITGDVLGGACEIGTAVALLTLSAG